MLLALLNNAAYYSNGEVTEIKGQDLMAHAKPYYISPAYAFVGYPNRDSTPFREAYNIPEAQTVVRGTLRYQGFPQFIEALVTIGWLETQPQDNLEGKSYAALTALALGCSETDERWASEIFVHRQQLTLHPCQLTCH